MKTVVLDKKHHDRKGFNCGVEALNNYLKVMASQQGGKDNTRTFVLEDLGNNSTIIGYYTLTMIPLDLSALPIELQKKHSSAGSAGLIARLAVDKRYAGQGYGEWLLIDALHKLLQASDAVGFPLVIVDAKEGVSAFYQRFGFVPFQDSADKLFITIKEIRGSLS
ncbi:GNAT family N-acetyltransferase [Endozoicomonas gorgoniicola]|uniref:GNAT family N-acetyltransferase n=1 Tax=Endozoicomonas gorgoniicola TaxID=1234144 RepID=A0ABT3MV95_9GAMM|nr:GNAT family N-acetyltransferase [Endozoicomonas gorgoniicola]MCW7552899.1 GNAT family N-acetyltransferase [Endozoicomonas gorgoniicola]